MKKVLGIKPIINYKKNENTVDIRTFRKERVLGVIENIGLKISPKWNRTKIPEKFMKEEHFPSVLKGLFDADGSVTIFNNNGVLYPRLEIKICPSMVQGQIQMILDKLNFNYRVQKLDKGKIRVRINGKKELERWFEIIGSSNNLHKKRAQQFLKKKVL